MTFYTRKQKDAAARKISKQRAFERPEVRKLCDDLDQLVDAGFDALESVPGWRPRLKAALERLGVQP